MHNKTRNGNNAINLESENFGGYVSEFSFEELLQSGVLIKVSGWVIRESVEASKQPSPEENRRPVLKWQKTAMPPSRGIEGELAQFQQAWRPGMMHQTKFAALLFAVVSGCSLPSQTPRDRSGSNRHEHERSIHRSTGQFRGAYRSRR